MNGTLYGVGVGPGDPELMTVKSVKLIRENQYIAVPGQDPKKSVAYQIAVQTVPELKDKILIAVYMPMTRDPEELKRKHEKGAAVLEEVLRQGNNIVYLTLGDPTIYSTFSYLQEIVEKDGFQTVLVSGIPSFCAAAARTGMALTEGNEALHVIPAGQRLTCSPDGPGNYVLMKSGARMSSVKDAIRKTGKEAMMVENCGMPDEKIYRGTEAIPDDAGYYSLIILKEPRKNG